MTGISISVASDAKAFASGVKSGVLEPLESVDQALQKVGDTGEQSGDQLVAALKSEQQATKQAGRDALDLATTVRRSEQQQTASVELSAREQKRLRREALKQAGAQAKQAAAQSASSIDGSIAGVTSAASGAAIGVLAALPPQFAALGAGGIAALGLIEGALSSGDERTQQFRQDVSDLAGELIAAGADGKISLADLEKSLEKLATETDSNAVSLSKLFDTSRASGNSFKDLAQAYAGNTDKLKQLLAASKEKLRVDQAAADQIKAGRADQNDQNGLLLQTKQRLVDAAGAQQDYTKYLQEAADKAAAAAKEQKQFIEAGGAELQAKADLIKSVDAAYDDAAGSVSDFVDAESGVLDTDKYIAAMTAKEKALKDYQQTLASSGLSDQAKAFLSQQGADAAATLLQAYKNGSAAQQAILAAIWNEAGSASSAAYTTALKNGLPATVPGPTVVPQLDTSQITRDLKQIQSGVYQVTINGRVVGKPLT